MANTDTQEKIKKIIFTFLNVDNINDVKKIIKEKAVYEYGCKSSTTKCGQGVTLIYTDNDNCFASYLIRLKYVGMCGDYAFDKESLTKSGIKRGCLRYTIFN